jgi:monoamine oxidase
MLRQFGQLDNMDDYTGTSRAGFPGQENTGSRDRGQRVSPLQFEEFVNESFWQLRQDFAHGLEQQPTTLQPVGGMDRIAVAFEAQIAQDIIYSAVVTEIRKITDGVRIMYDQMGTPLMLEADYCICARERTQRLFSGPSG